MLNKNVGEVRHRKLEKVEPRALKREFHILEMGFLAISELSVGKVKELTEVVKNDR